MTIGLKDLVYATITEGENSVPTYGTPKKLAEVMTADLSVTTAEGTLYADDAVSESVKEFVKGALKLGIKDLETEDVATLLGQEVDDDKVIYGGADDERPGRHGASRDRNDRVQAHGYRCVGARC